MHALYNAAHPKPQRLLAADEHVLFVGESATPRRKTGNSKRGDYSDRETDGSGAERWVKKGWMR